MKSVRIKNHIRTTVNKTEYFVHVDDIEAFKALANDSKPLAYNEWTHPTTGEVRKYFTPTEIMDIDIKADSKSKAVTVEDIIKAFEGMEV